jgi:hypothetical protein
VQDTVPADNVTACIGAKNRRPSLVLRLHSVSICLLILCAHNRLVFCRSDLRGPVLPRGRSEDVLRCGGLVRRTHASFAMPFYTGNDQFTKTGSGKTGSGQT